MLRKITSYLPERVRPQSHTINNVVATIRLQGVIASSASRPVPAWSGTRISLASHEEMLRRAFELPGLKAVALVINSPGGSPAQSSLLYQRIKRLRDRAQKERDREFPIIAFCEDVAASGGYYLACAADEIYADPNSLIGSIGVVSQSFGLQHIAHKLELERRTFTAGKHKLRNDPFAPQNIDDVKKMHSLMAVTHQNFINVVKESRGARLMKFSAEQLFDGDIHIAPEALKLGLIDGIGEVESTCKAKWGEDLRFLVVHPPRKGFLEQLSGGPFAAGASMLAGRLLGGASASGDGSNALHTALGAQQLGYELLDGAIERLEEHAVWAASGANHIRW